jgi:hypothetical protein
MPNIPVNCITIDLETDSANVDMYIGTDVGVFYKKDLDTIWQYYGTGMPNTEVADLEIFYPTRKLRAGTHGRGIFEIDLNPIVIPANTNTFAVNQNEVSIVGNPVKNKLNLLTELKENQQLSFSILDATGKTMKKETAQIFAGKNNFSLSLNEFANGIYFVEIRNSKNWSKTLKFVKN